MELTGRRVFFIVAGFFGVVISVNLTMAFMAVNTFPGLEVKNSYAASQTFQAEREAQEALGWNVDAELADGMLAVVFTDDRGAPVEVESMDAVVGRATHVMEDREPDFSYARGVFTAPMELGPGNWNIRLEAMAPDGTPFRQRVVLRVN